MGTANGFAFASYASGPDIFEDWLKIVWDRDTNADVLELPTQDSGLPCLHFRTLAVDKADLTTRLRSAANLESPAMGSLFPRSRAPGVQYQLPIGGHLQDERP